MLACTGFASRQFAQPQTGQGPLENPMNQTRSRSRSAERVKNTSELAHAYATSLFLSSAPNIRQVLLQHAPTVNAFQHEDVLDQIEHIGLDPATVKLLKTINAFFNSDESQPDLSVVWMFAKARLFTRSTHLAPQLHRSWGSLRLAIPRGQGLLHEQI